MHAPSSLLFTPLLALLALLALTPSVVATPVAQEPTDPTPSPDFSRCNFIQIIRRSWTGPFTLTALSDTLPLQEWPVIIQPPSVDAAKSLYISDTFTVPPFYALTEGTLNVTGFGEGSYPGRFVPSSTKPLQRLVFGGRGEPSDFYWIQNCDANGEPYPELKAGRGRFIF